MSEEFTVTSSGVYDIPAEVYHADPVPGGSLSSSGAKKLLTPSCPALFDYERRNGGRTSRVFDYGTAAHVLVLGTGPTIHVIEAANYRTRDAQDERDDAYAMGRVPLLRHEYDRVVEMANALREHPFAGMLFTRQRWENGQLIPASGKAEQSLFWQDSMSGIWRRCRLDWLPEHVPGTRMVVADYKTCVSASNSAIERAIENYQYHMQAAWNTAGIRALGLSGDDNVVFAFVFQEKTAPYLVNVVQLTANTLRIGRAKNRQAIDIYRKCTMAGRWPGYSDGIELVGLPAWAENREMKEIA